MAHHNPSRTMHHCITASRITPHTPDTDHNATTRPSTPTRRYCRARPGDLYVDPMEGGKRKSRWAAGGAAQEAQEAQAGAKRARRSRFADAPPTAASPAAAAAASSAGSTASARPSGGAAGGSEWMLGLSGCSAPRAAACGVVSQPPETDALSLGPRSASGAT